MLAAMNSNAAIIHRVVDGEDAGVVFVGPFQIQHEGHAAWFFRTRWSAKSLPGAVDRGLTPFRRFVGSHVSDSICRFLRYSRGVTPSSRRKASDIRFDRPKPTSRAISCMGRLLWASSRLARSMRTR